ncbi:unnamed protein product [Blepharisma stoltei]|uniref:Protein kinase domain-containing protein n=1 Tax=Blepharisma stoltei TaxID=1481888 RepID=A0AAU9K4A7_9CILI|nr:unnamed protein product [Blepharisma stoltei]
MNSVVNISEGNAKEKFWVKSQAARTIKAKNEIFTDYLWVVTKWGFLKRQKFLLTKKKLYMYMENELDFKNEISICWKTVKPFYESSDQNQRYGFNLSEGQLNKDFYTDSSVHLDQWLFHLSKIGICNDIEDDFDFIKKIGHGTFSLVYLAIDKSTNKEFAIKAINKSQFSNQNEAKKIIKNEISILRKLNHPGIAKLHKVYESDGYVYLVFDYLAGDNLCQRIRNKGPYSEKVAVKLMSKLLNILSYLNSKGVIHRDIKADNLILVSNENDEDFKLIDFGIACKTTENMENSCGTPGYIAPEVLSQRPWSHKADIFGAGIVFYAMLSQRLPFSSKSVNEIIRKNRECSIECTGSSWNNITAQAIETLLKLVQKDPTRRPTADEALRLPFFTANLINSSFSSSNSQDRKQKLKRMNCMRRSNIV